MNIDTGMMNGVVVGGSMAPVAVVVSHQVVLRYVRVVVITIIVLIAIIVVSLLPVFACQ